MNAHDHEHATGHGERRGLTRRQLLLGGLGAGALGLLLPELGFTPPARATTATAQITPRNRYRLAMHVHASFSEGVGSMYAALAEARRTNHDLVFFTDHDDRKTGHQDAQDAVCTSRARRSSRTPSAPGTGRIGPRGPGVVYAALGHE